MPAKIDKIAINNEQLDRRVKLTRKKKVEVKKLFDRGVSIHKIAGEMRVSRRLIQFVIYPERYEEAHRNWDWHNFYDKEKHRQKMKEHRDYKKRLLTLGLIGKKTKGGDKK